MMDIRKGKHMKQMRNNTGQSVVEIALVLPVFLLFFFGIIDFAHGFYAYSILNEACRSAVRNAAVMNYDVARMEQLMRAELTESFATLRFASDVLDEDEIVITIPTKDALLESPIQIRGSVFFDSIIAGIVPGIRNPLTVRASAAAYYETSGTPRESTVQDSGAYSDAMGSDIDNDGIPDHSDMFQNDPNEWADWDGDGIGDNADADDDNDGISDDADAYPNDYDNDGYDDARDRFPEDPSEWNDTDRDGIGNNADTDDDGDGLEDGDDPYPNSNDGDHDGISDADEIANGSDPTNPLDPEPPLE